jgi:hypothetical protein
MRGDDAAGVRLNNVAPSFGERSFCETPSTWNVIMADIIVTLWRLVLQQANMVTTADGVDSGGVSAARRVILAWVVRDVCWFA